MKFVSAEQFTRKIIDPQSLVDKNEFYPRILFATAGCIGAGMDSPDVYSVSRIGFLSSIIGMVQEMVRCGQGRFSTIGASLDSMNMYMTPDDYVYLNQRFYLLAPKNLPRVVCILSQVEFIDLQRANLLELLKIIVLRGYCWYNCIEAFIGNPLEPPSIDLTNCGDACPYCLDTIKEYIMPVNREGLSQLLAEVFINNPGGNLTPAVLVKKLTKSKDVGIFVYERPRSKNPPPHKYVTVTILQFIASELVLLSFDDRTNESRCTLVIEGATPAYLNNYHGKKYVFGRYNGLVYQFINFL